MSRDTAEVEVLVKKRKDRMYSSLPEDGNHPLHYFIELDLRHMTGTIHDNPRVGRE
jgi:hypothetical protein